MTRPEDCHTERRRSRGFLLLLVLAFAGAVAATLIWRGRALKRARRALRKEKEAARRADLPTAPPRAAPAGKDPLAGRFRMTGPHRTELYAAFLIGDRLGTSGLHPTVERLVAEHQPLLESLAGRLLADRPLWHWRSPASLEAASRSLQAYRALACLLTARAIGRWRAGKRALAWRDLTAALLARRLLARDVSGRALLVFDQMTDAALEGISALLRQGARLDAPEQARLARALAPIGRPASSVLRVRVGRMIQDVDLLLSSRTGRLADDYRQQAGTEVGLWFRQALAGPAFVQGVQLTRLALQAMAHDDPVRQLAELQAVDRLWVAWLQTVRTQSLYRQTPLSMLRRQLSRERRLRATRLALAVARYAATHDGRFPGSLQQLVPALLPAFTPADGMTGGTLRYLRAGDSAGIELPDAGFPTGRRRWSIAPPR